MSELKFQRINVDWRNPIMSSNTFLRSNLFSLSRKGERVYVKNLAIRSTPDFEMRFTGERFTQYDRDISIALKRIVIEKSIGLEAVFSEREILSKIGRKNYGKTDLRLLHQTLGRAHKAIYCINEGNLIFEEQSIKEYKWDDNKKLFFISMNENWIKLFNSSDVSSINLEQRLILPRGFCRWLHAYWSSYSIIPSTDIDELQQLCGSNEKLRGNFKKTVLFAMRCLQFVKFIKPGWAINLHGYIRAERF